MQVYINQKNYEISTFRDSYNTARRDRRVQVTLSNSSTETQNELIAYLDEQTAFTMKITKGSGILTEMEPVDVSVFKEYNELTSKVELRLDFNQ